MLLMNIILEKKFSFNLKNEYQLTLKTFNDKKEKKKIYQHCIAINSIILEQPFPGFWSYHEISPTATLPSIQYIDKQPCIQLKYVLV